MPLHTDPLMPKDVQYRADVLAFSTATLPEPVANTQDSFIDIPAVLRTLRRRIGFILGTGLLFFLLSVSAALVMRNRYTATATFIPPGSGVSGASAAAGQLAQLSGLGGLLSGHTSADLYIGILRSRIILDKLIQRFNMLPVYKTESLSRAEMSLAGHTDVTIGKDSIIAVTFTDHDPNRARDVTNAYLQELQAADAQLALTESSARRLFFEQRLTQEKNALADAEVALKKSQEKSGLIAPAGQTSAQIGELSSLRSQIATRRVRLASLLHDETDQNPDVLRLRSEISNLEAQVGQMERDTTGNPSVGLSSAQVPGLELDYGRLAREVKYHEDLMEIIARQYEAARLDEAHETPLQMLDRARTPEGPSGPPRLMYMIEGLMFGLFVGALWVVFQANLLPPILAAIRESPNPQA